MKGDVQGETALLHVQDFTPQRQVPRTADRQKLSESLDHSESEDCGCGGWFDSRRVRRGTRHRFRGRERRFEDRRRRFLERESESDLGERAKDGHKGQIDSAATFGATNSMPNAWATGSQVSLPPTQFAAEARAAFSWIAAFGPRRASVRA